MVQEIKNFSPIKLKEMDRVRLMNRTDTKYWFHKSQLAPIFENIAENYFALNMDNETALPYATTYFDTTTSDMFIAHHNGKLNRYKIRRRSYVNSGISFLEVKFKSNKGRTIKNRIPSDDKHTLFTATEEEFLANATPFTPQNLEVSLNNNFNRITLVNKNFKERCTIDFDLTFATATNRVKLNDLVIVEIKSDGNTSNSPLAMELRDQRIKTSGFSKYCIGKAVTTPSLKHNAFKQKVRTIEKVLNVKYNLYQ